MRFAVMPDQPTPSFAVRRQLVRHFVCSLQIMILFRLLFMLLMMWLLWWWCFAGGALVMVVVVVLVALVVAAGVNKLKVTALMKAKDPDPVLWCPARPGTTGMMTNDDCISWG